MQQEEDIKLTPLEKDLIHTLRNYRSAYPNGARMMEQSIMEMVYELMEHE